MSGTCETCVYNPICDNYETDGCGHYKEEQVRCRDCKHYAGEGMRCDWDICVQFDHFYCYYGERKEE